MKDGRGFSQGEKAKEDVPIGRRGLNIGENMIVSGTLRRVKGRTHNMKVLNVNRI